MALDLTRFIARFTEEARDHLRRLQEGLGELEHGGSDPEAVNALFRSAHTIKGSSRMLKLTPITDTAHQMEEVLGALREGALAYGPELGRLLQRGIDAIAAQVDQVADGRELAPADPQLVDELGRAAAGELERAAVPAAEAPSAPSAPEPPEARLKTAETVRVQLARLDELIKLMGEVVSSHARLRRRLADARELERAAAAAAGALHGRLRAFARTLRDDVLAQELLMEELHGKALVMRMLPLAMVFEPAARLVRELARSIGKEVECHTRGSEIELDRQLMDRLGDPIVHLLRNSVDHGIEPAAQRAAAGKPRHGRLELSARQDGGAVVIEIRDDGGGLPLAAIRDKAVRKGMLSAEQAAALGESEVMDLIFQPGFSTSAIITEVSGRGVGMDVVKRTIVDDLQGAVAVDTTPGQGTTFTLRLPLSLALLRVLLVEAGGLLFGFTAQYVAELTRCAPEQLLSVAERRALVLHNEFVPVVALAELLGLPAPPTPPGAALLLVVLRVRGEKLALVVDALNDERDMVIKPLPGHLRGLALVAGMVTTGRSDLVGVLHAPALLELARRRRGPAPAAAAGPAAPPRRRRVLVVDDSLNTREIERDVLEAHGYEVTLAEDGLDGLQRARAEHFDAVLTDVEMPGMDGFSLTAALRGEDAYRHTPIVIVTSREKEEDKRRGIQVGADAYIVKGDFEQSSLVDTLSSLLG